MKIKIGIILFLSFRVMSSLAQQHYQMMGVAVENFLQNRISKFEPITITWNMSGAIQADLNDGINYVLEDQSLLAEGRLTAVLDKDPTVWQAYYYRAIARKLQNHYHHALDDLQSALKLNPNLYEAQLEMAKCYLANNALVESERAVNLAFQLDKKRAAAHFVKGCIYEAQNQGTLAISSFRNCLKADSVYHDARISIAMIVLVENKDEVSAINELTAVLALDSLQRDALVMRSILVFDKNKLQSLRDLTNLILVNPTNIIAYYLRGILLTNMQRYDRGFSDFQKVVKAASTDDNNFEGKQTWIDRQIDIQNVGGYTLTRIYGLNDDDATKFKQAFCLIMTNALDKSITVLNSTSNPTKEPLAVYLKAVAYEHQGNHRQAMILYTAAIKLDNTIADAYKKRGIYEQELKQWDTSISDLTTVLKLLPESYAIYKIRGVSYHHSKQYEKAIADYTVYLEHDSTNEQVIGYRGMSYDENNQRLKSYIDFGNSHNDQAFRIDDMLHLVDSVLHQGDTALAITALTSFVKARPAFTEAYVLKFRLHLSQKDWSPIELGLGDALSNCRGEAPKKDRSFLLTLKGMQMSRVNRPDEALDAFNEAIRTDKENAFAYLERGKFLLIKNKTTHAAADLKKSASFGNTEAKKLVEGLVKN